MEVSGESREEMGGGGWGGERARERMRGFIPEDVMLFGQNGPLSSHIQPAAGAATPAAPTAPRASARVAPGLAKSRQSIPLHRADATQSSLTDSRGRANRHQMCEEKVAVIETGGRRTQNVAR